MDLQELSDRVDEQLHEFSAIDLREEGGGSALCGSGRPWFPTLYVSGKTDKGIMSLPGTGKAVVDYKVRSRRVDEDREDGVPRYGADIQIQTIDPLPPEEEPTEMHAQDVQFLREFGAAPAAPRPASRRRPESDRGHEGRELSALERLAELEAVIDEQLHEFGGDRDRDGAGRFTAGSVPSPEDYAIADRSRRKKRKAAAGVGAGLAAAGAGVMAARRGKGMTSVRNGVARVASRLIPSR